MYFLALITGKRVTRRNWTELPITLEIIELVSNMALDEADDAEAPAHKFMFEWGPGEPIDDTDDEEDVDRGPPFDVDLDTTGRAPRRGRRPVGASGRGRVEADADAA